VYTEPNGVIFLRWDLERRWDFQHLSELNIQLLVSYIRSRTQRPLFSYSLIYVSSESSAVDNSTEHCFLYVAKLEIEQRPSTNSHVCYKMKNTRWEVKNSQAEDIHMEEHQSQSSSFAQATTIRNSQSLHQTSTVLLKYASASVPPTIIDRYQKPRLCPSTPPLDIPSSSSPLKHPTPNKPDMNFLFRDWSFQYHNVWRFRERWDIERDWNSGYMVGWMGRRGEKKALF